MGFFSDTFLVIRLELWVFWKEELYSTEYCRGKVPFSSNYIILRVHAINMIYHNCEVSTRKLHFLPFLCCIACRENTVSKPHIKVVLMLHASGWGIYINYLEIFCKRDLSLLPHYLFNHLYEYEFMDIYCIPWIIIHYLFFCLFLRISHLCDYFQPAPVLFSTSCLWTYLLYISCSRPIITHFSKELWLLLLKDNIRNQDTYTKYSWYFLIEHPFKGMHFFCFLRSCSLHVLCVFWVSVNTQLNTSWNYKHLSQ